MTRVQQQDARCDEFVFGERLTGVLNRRQDGNEIGTRVLLALDHEVSHVVRKFIRCRSRIRLVLLGGRYFVHLHDGLRPGSEQVLVLFGESEHERNHLDGERFRHVSNEVESAFVTQTRFCRVEQAVCEPFDVGFQRANRGGVERFADEGFEARVFGRFRVKDGIGVEPIEIKPIGLGLAGAENSPQVLVAENGVRVRMTRCEKHVRLSVPYGGTGGAKFGQRRVGVAVKVARREINHEMNARTSDSMAATTVPTRSARSEPSVTAASM